MRKERSVYGEVTLALIALASSWLAFTFAWAGGAIILYLLSMFGLSYCRTARRAFYWGLGIGTANAALILTFFFGLFSFGALALWSILGVWIALFTWVSFQARKRWGYRAVLLIPFFWVGLEYTRSELYPLKFSWLAPGMALSDPIWLPLVSVGYYGISLVILGICSIVVLLLSQRRKKEMVAGMATVVVFFGFVILLTSWNNRQPRKKGPYVAGIQFEFARQEHIMIGLDNVLKAHPKAEVIVLSEYSFDGPVPAAVKEWCRENNRYLVAGGKERTGKGDNDYLNTAYVIDPEGEVVHKQVKSVPIQFFKDGAPAEKQELWDSPWGPIGFAICYDLSYSRVIDRLIDAGAEALIIPTMDVTEWGKQEHILHARIPYVRAREYQVPIFRVASSGISQLVDADGKTIDSAPFPGPAKILGGQMLMSPNARVPILRHLCLPSAVLTLVCILWFCIAGFRDRLHRK